MGGGRLGRIMEKVAFGGQGIHTQGIFTDFESITNN